MRVPVQRTCELTVVTDLWTGTVQFTIDDGGSCTKATLTPEQALEIADKLTRGVGFIRQIGKPSEPVEKTPARRPRKAAAEPEAAPADEAPETHSQEEPA